MVDLPQPLTAVPPRGVGSCLLLPLAAAAEQSFLSLRPHLPDVESPSKEHVSRSLNVPAVSVSTANV